MPQIGAGRGEGLDGHGDFGREEVTLIGPGSSSLLSLFCPLVESRTPRSPDF
jgi:hypothetical protein